VRVSADADHPSSFELKDRYQVGGYPTLLIVDAQGGLIERIVGFSTAQELEARLEVLAPSGRAQDEATQTVVAELRGMAARGEWAAGWDRVQSMTHSRGGDEAVRFSVLSLALEFAEHVAIEAAPELARRAAELAPQPGLAASLIDRAARALRKSAKNDEAGLLEKNFGARLKAAVGARHTATTLISEDGAELSGSVDCASSATQHDLANAAWYQGSWQGAEDGRELFATAALRSAAQILSEDGVDGSIAIALPSDLLAEDMKEKMVKQQGPIHDLISALKAAALFSVAIPICTKMTQALPEDFTWHYKLSGLYRDAQKPAAALPSARRALEFSYGDNRLRAIAQLAEILSDLEQVEEAKQLIEAALSATPPTEQAVRTHRYRRRLQELMQTWHDTQRRSPR
jgi:tetratricopeptide (TPR) repeat protein